MERNGKKRLKQSKRDWTKKKLTEADLNGQRMTEMDKNQQKKTKLTEKRNRMNWKGEEDERRP